VRGDRRKGVARRLRKDSTDAERKLWAKLRNRQLDGLKFKRQVLIGRFIADFACKEHHLVVEVDGGQHNFNANIKRDAERTALLEAMGYMVLRFENLDVLQNMDGVLTDILHQLHRLTVVNDIGLEPPHPVPLPAGERGRGVNVGARTHSFAQTSEQKTAPVKPGSPRPGGERDRVRGFQTDVISASPSSVDRNDTNA
jgi:very-short-patch-repair endonuclease